ncbi:acetate kinase [Spiroplasma alleghenense]|uniref:Acetate kinase n=1 Tax=Spiroplasma alleghenense TaxID=216931 RepID=A0A345Z475_9MOLU|nr:acetate kinase [Spiroplasma alleghenense]AXK51404.1 acetate kinase [Spiroplasma alleghenense]
MYMIINSGSSSIKFKLFSTDKDEKIITEGIAERIGIDGRLVINYQNEEHKFEDKMNDHNIAVEMILKKLLSLKIIENYNQIETVGSRVVHGGEQIKESVVITPETKEIIKKCIKLAPLHNPGALVAIEAFEKIIPNVLQVAAFDTSFHQSLAPEQYLYPVPNSWYDKYEVRKYGFHGISYKYICEHFGKVFKKDVKKLNLVICHLGNGSSVCCVKNGVSFDTTMGFTPLAGLMMGTRSGDIDSSVIEYMVKETNSDVFKITQILNKESGLLGVSEVSSDMRDITAAASQNNSKAQKAFEMYTQRVAQTIVQYLNNLDREKIDGIVFTAGIGENSNIVRQAIIDKINIVNLEIDNKKNLEKYDDFKEISSTKSEIKIYAFRTNEEQMILNDIKKLKKNK